MATRRNVPEKTVSGRQAEPSLSTQESSSAPAVPPHVVFKLLGFTLAMVCLPIGSYFLSLHTLFSGNATYAGGFAAIMANVVLIAYIVVAMKEDDSDNIDAKEKRKKG